MFSSESMINQTSISRRDDLESLMYIVTYLKSGTLPVIDFINDQLDTLDMNKFLGDVLDYRINSYRQCQEQIKVLLGPNLRSAYLNVI